MEIIFLSVIICYLMSTCWEWDPGSSARRTSRCTDNHSEVGATVQYPHKDVICAAHAQLVGSHIALEQRSSISYGYPKQLLRGQSVLNNGVIQEKFTKMYPEN